MSTQEAISIIKFLFDLFSLSLGVGLGLAVNLEPPHLLHQACHIVEKLLLARIVHLEKTGEDMNFKAAIFSGYLWQLDSDGQFSDLLKPRVGSTQALKEEKGRLNIGKAHVHVELSKLLQGVLLQQGSQHFLAVVHLVVCSAEQVNGVSVGDGWDEKLLQVGCMGPQPLEGCTGEIEANA